MVVERKLSGGVKRILTWGMGPRHGAIKVTMRRSICRRSPVVRGSEAMHSANTWCFTDNFAAPLLIEVPRRASVILRIRSSRCVLNLPAVHVASVSLRLPFLRNLPWESESVIATSSQPFHADNLTASYRTISTTYP